MDYRFNPYITVTEVAKYMGIDPRTVIMLVRKGELPSMIQVGGSEDVQKK